ncbi:MAG: hypothetical protein DI555_02650 [Novosphingobium pentaromativorans]|uniref:Uncharacterized protein n=1 Tax=Novosphingobium pentaromativorans TaxID=205844 RepID=A0A2W5NYP1_9SPHN|nr:MAG: hypothetical protein DI555_02650 [Novosphingobium pentaromativorans]
MIFIENCRRILSANYGVDRAEAAMFDVVDLVREHPGLRQVLLTKVRNTLAKDDGSGYLPDEIPSELIELAAHEFRWPEFETLASDRVARFPHAWCDIGRGIADAMADGWEDREFFRRYKTNG